MQTLSKSRYLSGKQCELKLWYECHRKDLASEITDAQQAIFDTGHEVGKLACKQLPEGVLVAHDHTSPELALKQTAQLVVDGALAIFEAAFLHDNVLIRADILERDGNDGWVLHEVKSSTSVKETHHDDVAVQRYVLEGAGIKVLASGVVTLDRDYIFDGHTLDLKRLFKFHDLTDLANDMTEEVVSNLALFNEIITRPDAPNIEPGEHCSNPYVCPYLAHCTHDIPVAEFPISEIPRLSAAKKQELTEDGIMDISEIPEDYPLTNNQQRVRQAVATGKEFISPELPDAIAGIEYPVYYLDFEATVPAIPRYEQTRAYDAVPFQFSLHVENENREIIHREFLHSDASDPRPALARALIEELGDSGTICVYSGYEKRTINDLMKRLPEHEAALQKLVNRLWDLNRVISNHYYHPEFHGSLSIKKVLPVLVSDLSYAVLGIQDGSAAARLYLEAIDSDDNEFKEKTFSELREYCGLDTFAMVKLKASLAGKVNNHK